ncbi:MAG: zinc ribbon domain-containing protein [Verrucomicrobiota bacterium]
MIQTSLANLIIFNLAIVLGGLAIVWIGKVCAERRRERNRTRHQVVCAVCGHVFGDPMRADTVVTCPRCGRLVERQALLDL